MLSILKFLEASSFASSSHFEAVGKNFHVYVLHFLLRFLFVILDGSIIAYVFEAAKITKPKVLLFISC